MLEVTVSPNIEPADVYNHIQRHKCQAQPVVHVIAYTISGLGIYIGINPSTDESELKHELEVERSLHYLCQAMVSAVRSLPHSQGYRPPPRHAARATYFT